MHERPALAPAPALALAFVVLSGRWIALSVEELVVPDLGLDR